MSTLTLKPGGGSIFGGDLIRNLKTGEVMQVTAITQSWVWRDHRLWDDWEWIEHSLEAHAALEHFEKQSRMTSIDVNWNEDEFMPRLTAATAKHKSALLRMIEWGSR